jgi:hypothetical protein
MDRRFMPVVLLACLVALIATSLYAQPNQDDEQGLFLPIVLTKPVPLTPLPTPLPTPPPDASIDTGALFLTKDLPTNSAAIAVDATGRLHSAYATYRNGAAFYASCASRCTNPADWASVAFGEDVQEVQLALTPDGKPRLLLRSEYELFGSLFQYAACDTSCTEPANWTVIALVDNRLPGETTALFDRPQHYFALDPQGRPRFIFTDERAGLDSYGTFYAYCDNNCSAAKSWFRVTLDTQVWSDISLAFTSNGEPRIAYQRFGNLAIQPSLYYVECAAICETVELGDLGLYSDIGFVLRIDANDHARMAVRRSRLADGTREGLFYYSCNTGCLQESNWRSLQLSLPETAGLQPDLAFDNQDRPRIAFQAPDTASLGYAWCQSNCEDAAAWQTRSVEDGRTLDADWYVLPPAGCDTAWVAGLRPVLAIDNAGQLRFAYDAENITVGCTAQDWYRAVRIVLLPQPSSFK